MEKPDLVVLQIKRGDIISFELADLVWLKGNPYARPRPDLGGSTEYHRAQLVLDLQQLEGSPTLVGETLLYGYRGVLNVPP
jgi:hypothetical protein